MLELNSLLQAAKPANKKELTPKEKANITIAVSVIFLIEVALWIWAIIRALKCSQATPDSRALHLLFAIVSPTMYLIFSFTVDGFCKKNAFRV